MVEEFLSRGIRSVLWLNPYPARLPCFKDLIRNRKNLYKQTATAHNDISVLYVKAIPVEPLPFIRGVNSIFWHRYLLYIKKFIQDEPFILGIGRPVMFAVRLLEELSPSWSFYDAMDDFPQFHSGLARKTMRQNEIKIISMVDTVYVSSTSLKEKVLKQKKTPLLIYNGCHFPCIESENCNSSNNNKDNKKNKIIGYVGSVASWFDWQLILEMGKALPDFRIRIVGPVFDAPGENIPENVELLPPCNHDKAIEYIKKFDLGIIPFKKNDLTSGVDPIKYYEFRSFGVPTLTTAFGEMKYRGREDGVFFIDKGQNFFEIINEALAWKEKVTGSDNTAFYMENNWKNRFAKIHYGDELI